MNEMRSSVFPNRNLTGVYLTYFLLLLFALSSVAAAQTAKEPLKTKKAPITDSILGVSIGTSLDDAHRKLERLGTSGGHPTRRGGRKEAWTLKKTDFTSLALQTDAKGHVVWVTGFLRPGKEIRFSKLGDLSLAIRNKESQAIWNVETQEGGYRLVAKGANGKARVIYLLSLAVPPVQ